MNPPPLPQPHRFTCQHCGFGWSEGGNFCPHCGTPQAEIPLPPFWRFIGRFFLALVVFVAGSAGSCASLLGVVGGVELAFAIPIALGCFVVVGLAAWGFKKLGGTIK